MGEPKEVRPGRGAFHENPACCICEDSEAKKKMGSVRKESSKGSLAVKKDEDAVAVEDQNTNDELEWSDPDEEDDLSSQQGNTLYNETSMEDDTLLSEEPELDELLSDWVKILKVSPRSKWLYNLWRIAGRTQFKDGDKLWYFVLKAAN